MNTREMAVVEAKELVRKSVSLLSRERIIALDQRINYLFKKYDLTWTELGFPNMGGEK